jgi:23S rRNA (cytosine1962-C5)-methyltransferase
MAAEELETLLDRAMQARQALFDPRHESAFRLFNGFLEGCPELAIDLYAATAVIHNYAEPPASGGEAVQVAQGFLLERLPWLRAIVLKARNSPAAEKRNGHLIHGTRPDRKVREAGTCYAVDLTMHRDASLYLDTRGVRAWAQACLAGKSVLNTFAYTGSLGAAALAGGAARVVQLDRNRRFLNLARTTYTLNGFPISKDDFLVGDFWPLAGRLRRTEARFDCVFLDPPYFSATEKGVVDLGRDSARLINKVRPLVADGGSLVAINNALYVSGREYLAALEDLCADGYLAIETLIPVPEDFTGYPATRRGAPVSDPAPFNHATKIAVLRVRRKA